MIDMRDMTKMEPIKRIPLVDQVEERIEKMIQDEQYQPGMKLPPEVVLTRDLNVSRGTIREAFKSLQAKGVIELRSGKGAFVADPKDSEQSEAIHWLVENEEDMKAFFELREAIEPMAARLAAERGGEEMREELQAIHNRFASLTGSRDNQQIAQLDEEFHRVISDHCGNGLIQEIMQSLNLGMKQFRVNTFKVRQNIRDTTGPHNRVLTAILAGDADKAEREMRKHVRKVAENFAQNISSADYSKER